jgi:hypothetical protein
MKRITLLITLTLLSTSLYAQGSVQADRPGFGFGSFITPVGSFGIETGVTTSEFGTNVGELFLRTGITESFEVTLNPGYQFSESTSGYIGFSYVENEFFDWKNYEFGVAHLIHSNSQIDLGLIIDEESDPYLTIGFATRF